ncbi:cysteine--1-D-myo-inosityl 2-amino-2-deoxy-alpha-D-glucopyranoside ligase [Zafaria sp. Z1313]|uniref:cysteine--1-D-myo-inosityl 2-amino-2-deoxy-alpha-D-glucopyranoside ligase n=1 Tax=unclassified Zafaria TaxID=2828765 RepID=UPI003D30242D
MHAWKAPHLPALAPSGHTLRIHDSRTGALETPRQGAEAGLYVCGITPYDATHLGHAATYVAFDLLHRFWRSEGIDVHYVQNVTDVDDPLLERATATGVDWRELAAEQTELFRTDMEALSVLPPRHYVGAVESVEWIVPVVERMLAAGLAYRVPGSGGEPDGDVYFDAQAAANGAWSPGSVSGYTRGLREEYFAARGGDPGRDGKRDALDPLLWRVERDGEPAWDGAGLGRGRPGWHIECSVIARRFLPAPFTVQGGGSDLVFPHHEYSAGHASATDGRPLAEHYVHTGMVGLDGEKMSKSKGNLVLVSVLRSRGADPRHVRAAILSQHYRSDWSWTDAMLERAGERVRNWSAAARAAGTREASDVVHRLRAHLADDLDAPASLDVLDAFAAAPAGDGSGAAALRDAVDALLGIRLD